MIPQPIYVRILIALAAAQPLCAGAQEIHGVVANEVTGIGLPGAEVRVLSLDGTVLATVGTDAVGRFMLRLPAGGRILLSAHRVGYLPLENVPAEVSSLTPLDIVLSLEPETPPAPPRSVFRSASSGSGGGPDLGAAGLHVRFGASGNSSLVSPRGFGAGAAVRLTDHIEIRVDVGRYGAQVDRTGRTCRQIQPVDRFCTDEMIMGSTSLTSLELAAALSLDIVGPISVGLGVGPVVGVIGSEAQGVSGRLADVALPKTAHVGFAGLAELRVIPDALPLFLTVGLRLQRLHPDGCLGDPPLTEQPFCGPLNLRWSQLEIGWRR